jgi:hypothetical protein
VVITVPASILCLSDLVPVTVNVVPLPDPVVSDATINCGETATLTASGSPADYTWYSDAGGTAVVGSGPTFVTPILDDNTTFYVASTSGPFCTSGLIAVNVTVIPLPLASASDVTIECGETATLIASGSPTDYSWYEDPAGTLLIGTGSSIDVSPLISTTYYVASSSGGSQSSSYDESFNSMSLPSGWTNSNSTSDVSANAFWKFDPLGIDYGMAGTTDHTGNGGTFAWVDGSTPYPIVVSLTSQQYPQENYSELKFFMKRNTTGYPMSPMNLFTVDFYDGNSWNNAVFSHTSNTAGGNWEQITVPLNSFTISGQVQFRLNVNKNGLPYPYHDDIAIDDLMLISSSTLCISALTPVQVTVTPLNDPIVSDTTIYCGESVTLTASGSPAHADYIWYADAAGTMIAGTGATFALTELLSDTTFYVAISNGGSCMSSIIPVTVTVDPISSPIVSDAYINPGEFATLTATGSPDHPNGYIWYADPAGTVEIGTGDTYVTPILNNTTTYYVQSILNTSGGSGTIYTFTNCGATGRFGPTQSQVNSAYSGTSLSGEVTINTQGIQEWVVPATGTYRIESYGAQGGVSTTALGLGAFISGDFDLNEGDKLYILVGQQGNRGLTQTANFFAGGGGGTFVATGTSPSAATPLLIAGGGGGNSISPGHANQHGQIVQSGASGSSSAGGTSGGAGAAGSSTVGGSGFYGSAGGGSLAFVQGGIGAESLNSTIGSNNEGGFGGGGGVTTSGWFNRAGGGGGYSGGGASAAAQDANSHGGGGGSYNIGLNQDNLAGANTGHGYVVITSPASTPCVSDIVPVTVHVVTGPTNVTATASPNPLCEGETLTLTGDALDATGWSWTGPNGFTSTDQSPVITNVTTAASGVYTLIASNSGGSAPAVQTAYVTVNPLPQGTLAGNTICEGGTGQLTFTASSGTGPYILVINGVTYSGVVGGSPFTPNPAPTSTTGYTLTSVTDNHGCIRTSNFTQASATITVNPLPQGVLTGGDICEGGTGELTFISSSGTGPFTLVIDGQSYPNVESGIPFTVIPNPTSTTSYTLTTITDDNGCSRTTGISGASATITVHGLPQGVLAGSSICLGSDGLLTFTASVGTGPYTLIVSGETYMGVMSGVAFSVTSAPVNTSNYELTSIIDTYGCERTTGIAGTTATINVNPAPAAVIVTGSGTDFCGSTLLEASGGSGGTIYWQGTTSNGTSTAIAATQRTVTASGTYYFRSYDGTTCWGPEGSATVTIESPPTSGVSTGDYVWGGSTDEDWTKHINWLRRTSSGYEIPVSLPSTSSNIFVRTYGGGNCPDHYPVLESVNVITFNSIDVQSGASISVAPGTGVDCKLADSE